MIRKRLRPALTSIFLIAMVIIALVFVPFEANSDGSDISDSEEIAGSIIINERGNELPEGGLTAEDEQVLEELQDAIRNEIEAIQADPTEIPDLV